MSTKYRISKENGEWIVSNRSNGLIIAYFEHKIDAEDYAAAQRRADEQSQVLRAFNDAEELRCLAAEFAAEFA
jgi:hypothetical protein